ncbi:MAG: DNA repair protein RadC [Bacteroidales bacterium]|jgi:DNA repair protein RadC|nr:DNA repair protein RadC [Bacteroidales bacterium]
MSRSLTIKEWSEDDRPREKLLKRGVSALSNAELLAVIIGSGSQEENAVDLAKRVLAQSGNNLTELGKATIGDLKKNKGIGEAKAIGIMAAIELGRRRNSSGIIEKQQIKCSEDIFRLFHPIVSDLPHEEFWLLFLNASNRVIDMQRISSGGLAAVSVDVRLVMKQAIERLAAALALCHNHPSGNLRPSRHDQQLTDKIKKGGELLEIRLLDHIIIADNKYYSFADENHL